MADITPSRYTSETELDVSIPLGTAEGTLSVDVTNSSGTGSSPFTLGSVAEITRTPHAFDNLNWLVVVSNTTPGGSWEKPDGTLTQKFVFHTLANSSGYGIVDESISLVDQDLNVDPINFNLGEGPHKTPLAPIPSAGFSISNLELWYHQLSEINGGDLNLFEGANVKIYMCSSLAPAYFWNSDDMIWVNEAGSDYPAPLQFADPTILSPNYPTNEFSWKVFTGTIQDISFSASTTSFDCIGINDLQNTNLGTLSDAKAQAKDRGKILPISYGVWQTDGDLMPVILDRDQQDVPRIILGEYDHQSIDGIRLFDKVSERDFFVLNTYSPNAENTEIEFREDTASADLGANISEDVTEWDQGPQVDTLLDTKFGDKTDGIATEQLLTSIDSEMVAFHDNMNDPVVTVTPYGTIGGQKPASRAWGNSNTSEHTTTSEVFEVDADYQRATAIIAFSLPVLGMYKSLDANGIGSAGELNNGSGSYWNTLKTVDTEESDSSPNFENFLLSGQNSYSELGSGGFYSLSFEPIGFTGVITKIISSFSTWTNRGSITNPGTFAYGDWFVSSGLFLSNTGSSVANIRYEGGAANLPQVFSDNVSVISSSVISGTDQWDKFKTSVEFENNLPDFDDLTGGALSLKMIVIPSSLTTTGEPDGHAITDFVDVALRAKVDAQDGLWFVQGEARDNGATVIETPTESIQDIFTKDLNFSDFGDITSNRSDWKSDFSIYGKQKKWRKVLKEFAQEFAMGSFNDRKGQENLIDLDTKAVTLDIAPSMVLKNGNLQAVDYSFTDRDDLYNEILVKFRQNPANGDFLNVIQINEDTVESTIPLEYFATDAPGIRSRLASATTRLGLDTAEKKTLIIESSFIRRTRTAEQLIEVLSQWWTSTKAIVTVKGTFSDFYYLALGDQVTFNYEWGGLPTKILDGQFMIIGHTINPAIKGGSGSIDLRLIEIPTL